MARSGKCHFLSLVCKMVRPMLSDVVLSVCLFVSDVGALLPNGWMDQDETPDRANMPENQFVGLGGRCDFQLGQFNY